MSDAANPPDCTAVLKLRCGRKFLVDSSDLEAVQSHGKWFYDRGYIRAEVGGRRKRKVVYLHRLILGAAAEGLEVDHINGDRSDNRRSNLRACTRQQNAWNVPSRGVRKYCNGWLSYIHHGRKQIHLGCFRSLWEAKHAHRFALQLVRGEYCTRGIA